MSESEKPRTEERPESPTTAKALDFDDEAAEGPASPPKNDTAAAPASGEHGDEEEAAPPKPPRPIAREQQAENTLKEAFPTIDPTVIKAILRASGGKVEPAFHALLEMSDPNAAEPPPPPQPPRPSAPQTSTAESQLEADERYARQLAEQYNGAAAYGVDPRQRPDQAPMRGPVRQGSQFEERERNFIDDDLPVIRDNIKKGFLETQSTVNKWVTNLKKRIDGDEDDDFHNRPAASAQGYVSQQQYGGRRSSEFGRRSTDRDRYDADPQVLGDDFAGLELRDNEGPRKPNRPLANPDLFKSTPPRPLSNHSGSGRRVSFQDGPPEEIDIHYPKSPSPSNNASANSGGKSSKWQPLASVDPNPVAENDPFSLGDSDDEEAKKKGAKTDDAEKLQQAAAEAMADNIGADSKPNGTEHKDEKS